MDEPIACTLTTADYAARAEATASLARRALRAREPIPNGARLTFEAGGDIERELRKLIAAEARCCPFLRMDLRPGADALVVDVTGPAQAEPIIADLFAWGPATATSTQPEARGGDAMAQSGLAYVSAERDSNS